MSPRTARATRLDGEPDLFEAPVESSTPTPESNAAPVAEREPLRGGQPPLVRRLNRNGLVVAAVVLGTTALGVLVFTRPDPGATSAADARGGIGAGAPAAAASPSFLDRPPQPVPRTAPRDSLTRTGAPGQPSLPPGVAPGGTLGVAPATLAGGQAPYAGASPGDNSAGSQQPYTGAYPPPPPLDAAPATSVPIGGSGYGAPTAEPVGQAGTPTASPRAQAYAQALKSAVLVASDAGVAAGQSTPATGTIGSGDSTAALASPAEAPTPPLLPPVREPGERAADAGSGPTTPVSAARFTPPAGELTLAAGTILPGFLVTGVQSDACGDVIGQTSRDVYDSRTQRQVLVPKGSRVIGRCSQAAVAGGRMLVAWTRLVLPDGRWMSLPDLAVKDQQGQTGVRDRVDNHYRGVVGRAVLLSVLSAGAQLSQPQRGGFLAVPSASQVATAAFGQQINQVALEIVRRGLDRVPTVVIRPGQPFNVFLAGDLVFDAPYGAGAAAGAVVSRP